MEMLWKVSPRKFEFFTKWCINRLIQLNDTKQRRHGLMLRRVGYKALIFGATFTLSLLSIDTSAITLGSFFKTPTAEANHRRDHFDRDHLDRGELRRTIRRIDRRIDRRTSLPPGCVRALINDVGYWRCGSIFYREVFDNDVKIFIIVEP